MFDNPDTQFVMFYVFLYVKLVQSIMCWNVAVALTYIAIEHLNICPKGWL